MAITITEQPTTDKFFSSEYPLIIKATSDNASIKYLKFQFEDTLTTGLDIPAYYAPEIDDEFTFNVSDYMNSYLSIIRDDLVSFDATPTVHVYNNLSQDVVVKITEIETDGTTDATATTNDFFMCKFKRQLYNANGTAEEYIDNRYFLTTLPYSRSTALGEPAYFYHRDGRQTVNVLTDYSRACFFCRAANTDNFVAIAYDETGSEIARCQIDLSVYNQDEILGIPMRIADLHTLSTTGGESGWVDGVTPVAVQDVIDDHAYIDATITDLQDQSTAYMRFYNAALLNLQCPKTFIYMNRFGVHEVLTLSTKTNESVVSSRGNATLVNTDWKGANDNDLGAYLLTGARQRSINPKSEQEFFVSNVLPYTPEQSREVMIDFFASPVHYVVDVVTDYGTVYDIEHTDTGFHRVRRITINDGKADIIKADRPQKLSFTYRYADV
jgi:hypothetical protein